jgi:hypothetical protein
MNDAFAVIGAMDSKLLQDRLLVFFAGLAITFPNGFRVFPRDTLYRIKVTCSAPSIGATLFLKYLSVTFNCAQFEGKKRQRKGRNSFLTDLYLHWRSYDLRCPNYGE